jgi:hypothetical protein
VRSTATVLNIMAVSIRQVVLLNPERAMARACGLRRLPIEVAQMTDQKRPWVRQRRNILAGTILTPKEDRPSLCKGGQG